MLFNTVESDTESTAALAATLAAAAARRPPPARRPSGDVGDPAANPVHPPPSGRVTRPRAAKQSAPPSAATRTAGRKTDGPLHGAAAPGGGGRPQAGPAARLPQHSGSNAIHDSVTRPATTALVAAPPRRCRQPRPDRSAEGANFTRPPLTTDGEPSFLDRKD